MADTTLSNLPTATGEVGNDALVYIVDDLSGSTATSVQAEYQDFQQIRFGTSTATGNFTVVLNDAYKVVNSNSTATHSIRIPPTSSVAWNRGTWIHIIQRGTGQVTVSSTSTEVQFQSAETVNARQQYSMISLLLRATGTQDRWTITGDLELA